MLYYFDINTCIVTTVFSYAACDTALVASNNNDNNKYFKWKA